MAPALPSPARQTATSLALFAALLLAWGALHVLGVFFWRWTPATALLAPLVVLALTWLNVGLFIVAHDCMHGSFAPGRPALNRWVGRLVLLVYAGFSFNKLRGKHFLHHQHPGSADDPDFHADAPTRFWPWYLLFFRRYFGWREFGILAVLLWSYILILGADPLHALLFWGVPAILSSVQLFFFGTYLPHRHEEGGFRDHHNARTNDYPWFLSLLTCFHFGYHHEHHARPHLPWWRLPSARGPA